MSALVTFSAKFFQIQFRTSVFWSALLTGASQWYANLVCYTRSIQCSLCRLYRSTDDRDRSDGWRPHLQQDEAESQRPLSVSVHCVSNDLFRHATVLGPLWRPGVLWSVVISASRNIDGAVRTTLRCNWTVKMSALFDSIGCCVTQRSVDIKIEKELDTECNQNCSCSAAEYEPLCYNNVQYFSPCHAGCRQVYRQMTTIGTLTSETVRVSIRLLLLSTLTLDSANQPNLSSGLWRLLMHQHHRWLSLQYSCGAVRRTLSGSLLRHHTRHILAHVQPRSSEHSLHFTHSSVRDILAYYMYCLFVNHDVYSICRIVPERQRATAVAIQWISMRFLGEQDCIEFKLF